MSLRALRGSSIRTATPSQYAPAQPRVLPARPRHLGQSCVVRAKEGEESAITGIVNQGSKLVDRVVEFVPESVPRPAAKAAVAFLGVAFVFGLVQKFVSFLVTIVVLGGLGYFYLNKDGGGDDDDSSSSKKSRPSDDMDDPLSDAQRIMDKYR